MFNIAPGSMILRSCGSIRSPLRKVPLLLGPSRRTNFSPPFFVLLAFITQWLKSIVRSPVSMEQLIALPRILRPITLSPNCSGISWRKEYLFSMATIFPYGAFPARVSYSSSVGLSFSFDSPKRIPNFLPPSSQTNMTVCPATNFAGSKYIKAPHCGHFILFIL